jgi:hypothetical protein
VTIAETIEWLRTATPEERRSWIVSQNAAFLGPGVAEIIREAFEATSNPPRTADDALAELIAGYPRAMSDRSVAKLIACDLRDFGSLRHPARSRKNELVREVIALGGGKRSAESVRKFARLIKRGLAF